MGPIRAGWTFAIRSTSATAAEGGIAGPVCRPRLVGLDSAKAEAEVGPAEVVRRRAARRCRRTRSQVERHSAFRRAWACRDPGDYLTAAISGPVAYFRDWIL